MTMVLIRTFIIALSLDISANTTHDLKFPCRKAHAVFSAIDGLSFTPLTVIFYIDYNTSKI